MKKYPIERSCGRQSIRKPSVTPNAASKTYGDTDLALTGTLNGFLAGDNVTAIYSRIAGGPYTISATLRPASVLGNYDITYKTATLTSISTGRASCSRSTTLHIRLA